MLNFLNKYIPKKDRPAFIFIAVTGTLSHFLYEWTGSPLTAFFCPINESVWEHLKLLFFPFLFWTLGNYMYKKPYALPYFYYRLLAVLCGMLSIITLFYTYTGIIGRSVLPLDILIFTVGIAVSLYLNTKLPRYISCPSSSPAVYSAWTVAVLCFFAFTCFPPDLPLFFPYS